MSTPQDNPTSLAAWWDTAMLPAEYERWVRFDVHRVVCRVDECPTCLDDPRSAS